MALPPSDHPCWLKGANGGLAIIKTDNLALQLLVKRIERSLDPEFKKAEDIKAFFAKWERMLDAEIAQLTSI
ncbi:hypothetical protein [Hydrogenophaga sp. 5NK40-0174]|uniref:hypothetical protein n=1 Tax=Hydrogenophaga sp. 5NK40-0174 TaxID=3127649 RepID=UPI00310A816D